MNVHEMLIAVPTKNHPKHIMYYLSKVVEDALLFNIDILIMDASDDDSTEKIVQNRIKRGCTNLLYKRYKGATLEERLLDAYVDTGYKYVWLCGDGVVINLRKDIKIVEDEIRKRKQIIVFGQYKIQGREYKEYTNSIDFCKDCFAQCTYFGSVILQADLVTRDLFEYCQKRYLEHAVPAIYYELFKDGRIRATYIYQLLFFDASPYKKSSIAMKEGRTIYAFAHLFHETILKLPKSYNGIKKGLNRWQKGMYDWGHLWAMRANGNLNLKIFIRERRYLRLSSDKKGIIYLLIVLCPHKLAENIALIEDKIW